LLHTNHHCEWLQHAFRMNLRLDSVYSPQILFRATSYTTRLVLSRNCRSPGPQIANVSRRYVECSSLRHWTFILRNLHVRHTPRPSQRTPSSLPSSLHFPLRDPDQTPSSTSTRSLRQRRCSARVSSQTSTGASDKAKKDREIEK